MVSNQIQNSIAALQQNFKLRQIDLQGAGARLAQTQQLKEQDTFAKTKHTARGPGQGRGTSAESSRSKSPKSRGSS